MQNIFLVWYTTACDSFVLLYMDRKIEHFDREVQPCCYHDFTVPTWGSEVPKSKYRDPHLKIHRAS